MGIKRIKVKNSRYRAKAGDKLINWGGAIKTNRVLSPLIRWFNQPPLKGINKLTCFNILKEHNVSHPEFVTSAQSVTRDHTWLARHTVTGSGGRGITIINPGDPVPNAPLYVKYIPKKYEVRIHVRRNGSVWESFDVQQKMQRRGHDANHKIRSHDNGFVFVRHGINIPEGALAECKVMAERACRAVQYDFGAVDVIYNEKRAAAYVLEINSSPGVENSTAQNYANMLRGMVRG
jgi:hypothetical protein